MARIFRLVRQIKIIGSLMQSTARFFGIGFFMSFSKMKLRSGGWGKVPSIFLKGGVGHTLVITQESEAYAEITRIN